MPETQNSELETSEPLGGKARRLANLRPPWAPGQSGNPSGRAKDGGASKDAPIRRALQKKAQKARELKRFVDNLWETACSFDNPGAGTAREQILKRLDPVLDDPQAGRQILTGLRLELQVGKGPVTQIRGLIGQQELRGSEEKGLLEGYRQAAEVRPAAEISKESQSLSEGTQVPVSPEVAADPVNEA